MGYKNTLTMLFKEFLVDEPIKVLSREGWPARKLCTLTTHSALWIFSIWLFLSCTLFNKW